ncbi:MAG: SAM-dependent methyltransferase [Pseudomonadota bacterium]
MTPPDGDLVRLSASDLWQRQKDFYCREGIGAWQGKIPYYATSNAFIANAYAQLIFAYLEDQRAHGSVTERAVIVELGAGPGLFAYYVVRRLDDLLRTFAQPTHEYLYVLTDVAQANIDYWCHHPAWEPYIAEGKVDFGHLDLAENADLTLEVSGDTLPAQGSTSRPMIAIANYVFDSIPVDIFRTYEGDLQQGLVPRSPQFESGEATNAAVTLEDIDSPIHYRRGEGRFRSP